MKPTVTSQQEYVLGTHDEEISRLGLQHRVRRPRVLAAWQSAEIGSRQTVLDVGCGPGYASLDLAALVGPSGMVVAIDKSDRFLEALDTMRQQHGIDNITLHKADLDAGEFSAVSRRSGVVPLGAGVREASARRASEDDGGAQAGRCHRAARIF